MRPLRAIHFAVLAVLALPGCVSQPSPEAAQCLAELSADGVSFESAAVPVAANGCGIANAVRVRETGIAWNQPAVMSCGLATRLDRFEREVLQPAALRRFGRKIVALRHFGSFDCRRESSGRNRLSQHAHGNAIDLAGFELADGTIVTVAKDWRKPGPRRDFLREVAHGACRYFSVVLTPASNAAHRDHIHLDIGPYSLCEA